MSKKKKTVKAPLTHDPGKGRPKEHLAYLNWQEMEALKRLNGNNVERGPKGLPSFATGPSDSLSAPNRTAPSTGTVSRTTATTTRSSGPSTTLSAPARTAPSTNQRSTTTNTRTTTFGISTPTKSTATTNQRSTTSTTNRIGSAASSQRSGAAYSTSNRTDAAARQITAAANARDAARSRAVQGDANKGGIRSINVGPMGTPVQIGNKVKGAISKVAQTAVTPNQYSKMNLRGPTGPNGEDRILPSAYGTNYQTAQMARASSPQYAKYDQTRLTQALNQISKALPGESDVMRQKSPDVMNNTGRVSLNQIIGGFSPEKAVGALDTTGADKSRKTESFANPSFYSLGMTDRWADKDLGNAYQTLAAADLREALKGQGVDKQAMFASNFGAAGFKVADGLKKIGAPVDGTQFWRDPNWGKRIENRQTAAMAELARPTEPTTQVAMRQSGKPPYAGTTERILEVENLMSDAGIRKPIPGGVRTAAAAAVAEQPRALTAAGVQRFSPTLGMDPRAAMMPGSLPAARPQSMVMTDPRTSIPPSALPAARAQSMVATDPRTSIAPAPNNKPQASVKLEPMREPKMPGAPVGPEIKKNVYTVKPGSITPEAEKIISDVLKNPGKIAQVAKASGWSDQDPKTLASIKSDIANLQKMGVKVEGGKITIPKEAAAQAQKTLNRIAEAYNPAVKLVGTKGYGKTFDKGLGKISEKGTVTEIGPPTAQQLSRYDMSLADYSDAMRGLGMSPSLQDPNAKYASQMTTRAETMVAGDPRVNMQPGSLPAQRATSMVAGDPRVGLPSGFPAARASSLVSTDPRVNMQPGALPAQGIASLVAGDPRVAMALPSNEQKVAAVTPPKPTPNPLNDPTKFIQVRTLEGTKPQILSRLVALQEQIGEPIRVTSGFRDEKLNKKVGGAKGSQHLQANAVDIEIQNPTPDRVANTIRLASSLGFTGIGAYSSGRLHIDLGSKRVWSNGNGDANISKLPAQVQLALADHKAGRINGDVQLADTGTRRLYVNESYAPWKAGVYDTPYPVDANGVPVQEISEADRAKIAARRRGEAYTPTPEEKRAITTGTIVTRVIGSQLPGVSTVINTKAKMTDFYSRPSWEQAYIAQRASDWAIARGDVPASPAEVQAAKQRIATHTMPSGTGAGGIASISTGGASFPSSGGKGSNIYEQIVGEAESGASGESSGEETALVSARPYKQYEWDLGINIPSPGSPDYTEFQGYLAERAAAQSALYG